MENEIKQHESSARVWSVCRWVEKGRDKAVAQTLEGLEELKEKGGRIINSHEKFPG